MKNGRIVLAQIEQARMDKLKKTGMLRWNRAVRTYSAPVTLDLLEVLAQIFPLPDTVEAERRRLAGIARQRHQVRAANMALIQLSSKPSAGFGLLFEMGCGKTLTAIAIMGGALLPTQDHPGAGGGPQQCVQCLAP